MELVKLGSELCVAGIKSRLVGFHNGAHMLTCHFQFLGQKSRFMRGSSLLVLLSNKLFCIFTSNFLCPSFLFSYKCTVILTAMVVLDLVLLEFA